MPLEPAMRSGWVLAAAIAGVLLGLVAGIVIGQAAAAEVPTMRPTVLAAYNRGSGPLYLGSVGVPAQGVTGTEAAWASPALDDYVAWTSRLAWMAELERRTAGLWARWGPVHACEQPDSWNAHGTFGNGMSGGGGLGISDAAWSENGGGAYSSTAAGATPEQQMVVAERIYERFGAGAWGCPVPG